MWTRKTKFALKARSTRAIRPRREYEKSPVLKIVLRVVHYLRGETFISRSPAYRDYRPCVDEWSKVDILVPYHERYAWEGTQGKGGCEKTICATTAVQLKTINT